jgi:hypothetical protein
MIIDSKQVLLERIDADDTTKGWQVIISVYRSLEDRYDEWGVFKTAHLARQFIADFSELAVKQFLTRAEQEKKKPVKVHA